MPKNHVFNGESMAHKIQLTIDEFHLMIAFTPRTALFLLVMTLMAAVAVELGSETLTMTTTYPSPAGIYRTIVTTAYTTLARDQGGATLTVGGGTNTTARLIINSQINDQLQINNPSSTSYNGEASVSFQNPNADWDIGVNNYGNSNGNLGIGNNTIRGNVVNITPSGNVGIGITSPAATLDVNGSVRINAGNGAAGNVLMSQGNGVGQWASLAPAAGCTVAENSVELTRAPAEVSVACPAAQPNPTWVSCIDNNANHALTMNNRYTVNGTPAGGHCYWTGGVADDIFTVEVGCCP